jgi:hypothetical protein
MNANEREWGMSYWLFVKSYWGEEEEEHRTLNIEHPTLK